MTNFMKEYWGKECTINCIHQLQTPDINGGWRTEAIFLNREEAEDYVSRQSYNYPKYRVWGTPCRGTIAKVLFEAGAVENDYPPSGMKFNPSDKEQPEGE